MCRIHVDETYSLPHKNCMKLYAKIRACECKVKENYAHKSGSL